MRKLDRRSEADVASIKKLRKKIFLLSGLLVACVTFCIWLPHQQKWLDPDLFLSKKLDSIVGFYSPSGTDARYVSHVNFSMINAEPKINTETGRITINLERLEESLAKVQGINHKIHIDLDLVITDRVPPENLNTTYKINNESFTKIFPPLKNNKIRHFPDFDEIIRRLDGLPQILAKHQGQIGAIFLADEPYLNGISREELNKTMRKLRLWLTTQGYSSPKIGFLEASVLFNEKYAKIIDSQMGKYVHTIDTYHNNLKQAGSENEKTQQEFIQWKNAVGTIRLATYDRAGNIYTEGGIPEEADVVTFDFYLSTTLMDATLDNVLMEFAKDGLSEHCEDFADSPISEWRKKLSFFSNGRRLPVPFKHYLDKRILDSLFLCRMESATALLKAQLKRDSKEQASIMLIGEASANGAMEFSETGDIKPQQPYELVESRILDEVKRSISFFENHPGEFKEGLMFFLYPDSYDASINLKVLGIEGSQSVTDYIYYKADSSIPLPHIQPGDSVH